MIFFNLATGFLLLTQIMNLGKNGLYDIILFMKKKSNIQEIVIVTKDESASSSHYLLESIKNIIISHGEKVLSAQYCGVRSFMATLQKNGRNINQTKGPYLWLLYTNTNQITQKLHETLSRNISIIRFLIVNVDKKSPILQPGYVCPLMQRLETSGSQESPDASRSFANKSI